MPMVLSQVYIYKVSLANALIILAGPTMMLRLFP
jgi:hypothetical protein